MGTQDLAKRNIPRGPVQARVGADKEIFNDVLTALDPRGDSERSKYLRFALAKSPTTGSANSSTARASRATSAGPSPRSRARAPSRSASSWSSVNGRKSSTQ